MTDAFLAGLLASSSLVIGAVIALVHRVSTRTLGLIMAFGAGVLISAVAYDLVLDAFTLSQGGEGISIGLALGALTFFFGDLVIDRAGGEGRKSSAGSDGSAKAIVLGTVLDGIPESIVIGLSFLSGEGVSVAVIAAVFLSNLPESMAATTGLMASGGSARGVLLLWTAVALVSAIAAAAGYVLLDDASGLTIAIVQAFAAGALLTMLADTMMPEAYEHGGPVVGLATTFGFLVAFLLASLEHSAS